MQLKERKISGREKDDAAVKLLEQLRRKLHCGDMSAVRLAAYHLSWMQEDGFDILKEALLDSPAIGTKIAAAYGLRNTHGRMKKLAMELFKEGILYPNSITREVCKKALLVCQKQILLKSARPAAKPAPGTPIRQIPPKGRYQRPPFRQPSRA